MAWARTALLGLASLFMIFVFVQFFFGGMLTFSGHVDGLEAHRIIGYPVLHTLAILMIVVAVIGKLGKKLIGMSAGLFVMVMIQPVWASMDTDQVWVRAMHIPFALALSFLGYHLLKAAIVAYRGSSPA